MDLGSPARLRAAPQDDELRDHFRAGWSMEEVAGLMQRQPDGIRSRLEKVGLK